MGQGLLKQGRELKAQQKEGQAQQEAQALFGNKKRENVKNNTKRQREVLNPGPYAYTHATFATGVAVHPLTLAQE